MPVSTTNGTTMGVSAVLPGSFDASGYDALTFTSIGEVIDVGELGKVFNIISHQPLAGSYPTKIKGVYDISDLDLTVGRITADAGQVLVAAGLAASASYSFKLTLPSGDVGEFTGKITKAAIGSVASDGIETTVVSIAVDPESLFVA